MVAAPPEGPELARAKTATETDFLYSLESQSALARHVGFYETTLNDAAFEQTYLRKIRAVTADDIQAVAKKYLSPGNLTVSAVLPDGEGGDSSRGGGPADRAGGVRGGDRAGRGDREEADRGEGGPRQRDPGDRPGEPRRPGGGGARRGSSRGCAASRRKKAASPASPRGCSSRERSSIRPGRSPRRWRTWGRTSTATRAATRSACRGSSSSATSRKGFACSPNRCSSRPSPRRSSRRSGSRRWGRLKQQKDQLTQATFLLFLGAHYGDHPYGRNPLGTENSVRAMTPADLKAYYERWADPRNMVIADLRGHRRGGGARGGPQGVRGDAAAAGVRGAGGVAGPLARRGAEGGGAARQAAGALRHRLSRARGSPTRTGTRSTSWARRSPGWEAGSS